MPDENAAVIQQTPPEPSPSAAPVVAEGAAVQSPPAAPLTRRETIEAAMKNPQPRGQHAKFQPRQDAGQFAPGSPQFPTPQRPDMPKSWNLELKPHWDAAPSELVSRFVQREEEMSRGVEPLKAKAQQADELLNEFRPYEMLLKTEGVTPSQAIAPLLRTAAVLRTGTPYQKALAVGITMRQYGISLEHVQQALSGNAPPQPALDPHISQLAQQVQQLTQFQQQQNESRAHAAIREFAADPEHKHFDAVSERMAVLLQTPQILGADVTNLSERDKLKLAYDTAVRMDPEVSRTILAEQQARTQATQQVDRAKRASVQVAGAPAAGPPPKANPNDRREVIRNAFNAHTR